MARLRTQYSTVTSSAGSVVASGTAPASPHVGLRWYNTATGVTYQYTSDGTSSFWIDISSGGIGAVASRNVDFVGDTDPHLETSTTGAGLAVGSIYYNREGNRYFVCTNSGTGTNAWSGRYAGFGGIETVYKSGSDFYKVHTFLVSGELRVDSTISCDILIVGGGGSGAGGYWSGGGGAGGMLEKTGVSMTAQTYVVTVGAGGAQHPRTAAGVISAGNSGFASSVSIISGGTAFGGGGGGIFGDTAWPTTQVNPPSTDANGNALGSGGGGQGYYQQAGGAATSGQGSAGGTGSASHGNPSTGGGGGGKGGAGETGANGDGGAGGAGAQNSYRTGSAQNYAAGGGGSTWTGGGREGGAVGGVTIGGPGGNSGYNNDVVARIGVRNTGSGGGAGWGGEHDAGGGGAGGSGIVVIRYQINA